MADSKGRSYVVLFAAFMTKFLGPSLSYVTGVFYIALKERYSDPAVVSWMGSLFGCMFALTCPIGSFLINRSDCRTCVFISGLVTTVGFGGCFFVQDIRLVFFFYALVAGLGTGLAQSGCMVSIGYYFKEQTSFASGICTCGSGLGIFIHPLLTRYLLDNYGIQGAFLLTGGITLNLCVCAMLMAPSTYEKERKRMSIKTSTTLRGVVQGFCQSIFQSSRFLKNVSFTCFALFIFSFSLSNSTLYLYLPDYFHTQGTSLLDSSFAISVSGIGSVISRILSGFAANDKAIGPDVFCAFPPGIIGLVTLFLPVLSQSHVGRVLYGFQAGLYSGCIFAMISPVLLEIQGLKYFASGTGIVNLLCGIGLLIGPPIAGAIFERSQYYYSVFLFSAGTCFLATTCACCSSLFRQSRSKIESAEGRCENADLELQPLQTDLELKKNQTDLELQPQHTCTDLELKQTVPELKPLQSITTGTNGKESECFVIAKVENQ